MNNLWNSILLPIIKRIDADYIVEIGSDTGINTQNILEYCMKHNAHLTAIDPVPNFDIDEFKDKYGNKFEFYEELSLSRLPLLKDYDVILLDGDHNWYTVYNELKIIEKSFKNKNNFPLIFLHDIGWPYARRDLYYDPENIPAVYRQPYKKLGMYPGQRDLKEVGGLNAHLNNSIYENNLKNGVMTAIEDFIHESDFNFSFEFINAFFGLGILYVNDNKIEKIVKDVIKNCNLLDILEENRVKSAIVYSELKNIIGSLKQKLNEEQVKLEEAENKQIDFKEEIKELNVLYNDTRNRNELIEGSLEEEIIKRKKLENLFNKSDEDKIKLKASYNKLKRENELIEGTLKEEIKELNVLYNDTRNRNELIEGSLEEEIIKRKKLENLFNKSDEDKIKLKASYNKLKRENELIEGSLEEEIIKRKKLENLFNKSDEDKIKLKASYNKLKRENGLIKNRLYQNKNKIKENEIKNKDTIIELKSRNTLLEKKLKEAKIGLKNQEYQIKLNELDKKDIKKLYLQIDDLTENFYKMKYNKNIGRSLSQRLISKFPQLYILFKSKGDLKSASKNINGYNAIKRHNLFDIGYYLKEYCDVSFSGMDPLLHYMFFGFKEGRRPNPTFDPNFYLKKVNKGNLSPLVQYSLHGIEPKISIIIASYNYAHLIDKAINSVISQTYDNWELIIVDDGSKDNSLEVIRKYTKNPKINLYQHEGGVNKGLKETVVLGLSYCTGEYVAFLESDDWLEDNYLKEKVGVLAQYPGLKFIFNDVSMFSNQKNFDFTWYDDYLKSQKEIIRNLEMPCNFSKLFVKHNFIPTFSCVLIEKDLLLSCNFDSPKDPTLDYWIFKQLASKTDFYYIDKKLTHWMMHKESYINDIFSPKDHFDGFELEENVTDIKIESVTDIKNLKEFDNSPKNEYFTNLLFKNNPNTNSDQYVKKSDRNFVRQKNDVKLMAFYLPQFHEVKENNEWWGNGFTEWSNVTKAQPQFIGHYQPQLPDELGFYDLSNTKIMHKQVEMAKKYGIYGFCFHYYWFSGKRLLEKPIFDFLNNKKLDFPFMLCWANESWTRTWTHFDGEVLMQQHLEEEDYLKFIQDIMPFFEDERYIKINNKPVLIVYRPKTFPKETLKAAIKIWRAYVKKHGFDGLHILNTKTDLFRDNPLSWNIDGTVQFPPNDMIKVSYDKEDLKILNPNFNGKIFDLSQSIEETESSVPANYLMYKGVFPSWDNTARKNDSGSIYYGSSPKLYKKWLSNSIRFTKENLDIENQFVFINAWNEWAEGCHLEPDRKYGFAYLEATLDALQETRSLGNTEIRNKSRNSEQIIQKNKTFSKPSIIAFIVTEKGVNASAGDYFTAFELGEALKEFGFEIQFISTKDPEKGYKVGKEIDFVISMLHDYDPREIQSSNKALIKVAWVRNWFDSWVKKPYFQDYDIVFASSKTGCDYINDKTGKKPVLLPIATNPSRFNINISPKDEYVCDYCFTGSYWNDPRDIIEFLEPEMNSHKFRLFGKNWDKVTKFQKYHDGFVNYSNLPEIYASTKMVIDDANRVTKSFGAVNSRVFDAIASGALVLTNGEIGAEETFNYELPVFRSKEELNYLINYYLENEDKRISKVKNLRKTVLENHTYKKRADTLKKVLEEHIPKLVKGDLK